MIILGINGPIEGILAFLAFVLFFVLFFYFMALLSKLSNGNINYKGTTLTDSNTFDDLNEMIFGTKKKKKIDPRDKMNEEFLKRIEKNNNHKLCSICKERLNVLEEKDHTVLIHRICKKCRKDNNPRSNRFQIDL